MSDTSHSVDITCPICSTHLRVPLDVDAADCTITIEIVSEVMRSTIDTTYLAVGTIGDVTVVRSSGGELNRDPPPEIT